MKLVGRLLSGIFRLLISFYQLTFRFVLGPRCRFYPSCSEYAKIALKTHPLPYAIWLSAKRLLKCHPWHKGGLDLVPEKDKA